MVSVGPISERRPRRRNAPGGDRAKAIVLFGLISVMMSTCLLVLGAETGEVNSAVRTLQAEQSTPVAEKLLRLWDLFPQETDWLLRELGDETGLLLDAETFPAAVLRLAESAGVVPFSQGGPEALLALVLNTCADQRTAWLRDLHETAPRLVFTRHYDLGGSHYAYTEGLSDAQSERHFRPGAALCLLEISAAGTVSEQTLLADDDGVIRDPDVSFDGRRVLFAWKQSDRDDDYHLYEMQVDSREVRQVTFGKGSADYEGIYLPDGRIVFSSTRCVQAVDCFWTEVSNLFVCDADGNHITRLGFDQVHTNFPKLLDDGRIIYTRWDYNDRDQIFTQPLFQMRQDGSGQTEYYGNNSWFPTSILHARGLPGTSRVLAVLSGHHTHQRGKLALIDPSLGRQETQGVRLVAPLREAEPVRVDAYGQQGEQFQYPYPLDDARFLVTYTPYDMTLPSTSRPFGLYLMDVNGARELLVYDGSVSCSQAMPLAPRPLPPRFPARPDLDVGWGALALQDITLGPGLAGIPPGTVRSLRVVALHYRAASIGFNRNRTHAMTPVSVGFGSWDVKEVLGETPVHADGSAFFRVPARTPVYLQALDEEGHVVQTMRSWTTLQPGETFSCSGCHESKDQAPPVRAVSPVAFRSEPVDLTPSVLGGGGFSFPKRVQPILDRHCVSCHRNRSLPPPAGFPKISFERETAIVCSPRLASWRYTTVDPGPGWEAPDWDDQAWTEGAGGFGLTGTPGGEVLEVWSTPSIWLRRTFDLVDDPAGFSFVVDVCHDEDVVVLINGVQAAAEPWFVTSYRALPISREAAATLHEGRNTLAVNCRQTSGGQYIDVALLAAPLSAPDDPEEAMGEAFSLRGDRFLVGTGKRRWSDAYLALTGARFDEEDFLGQPSPLVNWISAKSPPSMLAPYHAGSATSGVLTMLRQGHHDVVLADQDYQTLACWLDLLVPYCGDYEEASVWSDQEKALYAGRSRQRHCRQTEECAPSTSPMTIP